MYRSRWRSLSASKKFCAASCVRVCKSPQKLSCNSATKCWKCSVIGIIFAMGVGLLFWNGFSLRGQSQLTPSCFLHNRIYVTRNGVAQRSGTYEGSFPAESGPAGDAEPGAEGVPEADIPAAAALATLPFPFALPLPFPLEAGSGGTFVLSTT